jgi:photosystem II stability/assembly factor-like uncharacterized protein
VYFEDENNGWAVGGAVSAKIICDPTCRLVITGWYNVILSTTDGGANWSVRSNLGRRGLLEDIHFVDSQEGWAVGWNRTILHSTDGGATWSSQTSPVSSDFYGVFFADANHGWITGMSLLSAESAILHTDNGGSSWIDQSGGASEDWTRVHFVDANTGWVVGLDGVIVHTTDSGDNWTPQASGTTSSLRGVCFTDSQHGWAVGDDGTILHYGEREVGGYSVYLPLVIKPD